MSTPPPEDLTTLTSQASREVKKQARANVAPKPLRRRPVGAVLALAAAALLAYLAHRAVAPPSPEKIAKDLDGIVEQARASIEESRKATGTLPASLPNASLSSVVSYEPRKDSYQLTVTLLGVRVTLSPDGTKQTERGVQP